MALGHLWAFPVQTVTALSSGLRDNGHPADALRVRSSCKELENHPESTAARNACKQRCRSGATGNTWCCSCWAAGDGHSGGDQRDVPVKMQRSLHRRATGIHNSADPGWAGGSSRRGVSASPSVLLLKIDHWAGQ